MHFNNKGEPIARVYDTYASKKKAKLLSVDGDSTDGKGLSKFTVEKSTEYMQQIPNKNRERSILYITGSSGSGKSYYTRQYCEEYIKAYKNNPIYLFSSITEDSSIDKVKGLKRIKLSDEFLNTELSINDFKDSLIIFDDCDCITNKALKTKIMSIVNIILETGRHSNTSCIYTSHLPTAGMDTRRILNECQSITFFPNGLGAKSLRYLEECYLGLDKEQRKTVKRLPSRWCTYIKSYPNVILYERGSYVLNTDDD